MISMLWILLVAFLIAILVGALKRDRDAREVSGIVALVYLVCYGICAIINWFIAYFSPQKAVLVYINKAGEANGELLFNIIGLTAIIVYFILTIKNRRQ